MATVRAMTLTLISVNGLISASGVAMGQSPETGILSDSTTHAPLVQLDRTTRLRLASIDTSAAAFRRLDSNHDGRISALEAASDTKVATAFTLADKDKDGYLSEEEFKSIHEAATQAEPR